MSQKITIAQVLAKAEATPLPEKRIDIMLDAVREMSSFGSGNMQEVVQLLDKAKQESHQVKYPLGIARSMQLEGQLAFFRMDYTNAFMHTHEALALFEHLDAKPYLAEALMGLSMVTWDTGNYSKGLELAFQALRHCEGIGHTETGGITTYMIGSFYFDLKDYTNAQKYFQQSYDMLKVSNKRPQSLARATIGLGNIHLVNEHYNEAIEYFEQAKDIQIVTEDKAGLARSYNDLGKTYFQIKQYDKAETFFNHSIAIRETLGNHTGLITSLMDCSEMYIATDRLANAYTMLIRCLSLTEKLNTKAKRYRTYQLLGELHQKQGEWEKALHYFTDFYQLKEEVQGEGFSFEIRKLEKRLELEKKEQEAEIYRLRNVELKDAYERIEKKNRDITSSINYAKRIQDAMLQDISGISAFAQDYFVLFKPRDIVSGDFYWFTERDDKAFVAAVDCTGHGVPGAFMSLIGNNLLDQAIHLKELCCPAEILTYLHEQVQRSLHQSDGENNDGMDMTLCVIDKKEATISFAGAKNPLLYVQEGEMLVIKGDRMPIGGVEHAHKNMVFTKHVLPLLPNNCYYLFSDGFQDQFGQNDAGKYKFKRLKELFLQCHMMPMQEQKALLEKTLAQWMGEERQIDDILVLGLKF